MKRSGKIKSSDARKRFSPLFQAAAEVDVGELSNTPWRRRRVAIGVVLALTAFATLVVFQLAPRFTGEVYVMIDPGTAQTVGVEAVVSIEMKSG